jgi:ATP-dependent DNA helicase RecG
MELKDAEHFRKAFINPALRLNAIEMTIPDKPTSSNQKCRISAVGRQILESHIGIR